MAKGNKRNKGLTVILFFLFLILCGSLGANYFLFTKVESKKKEYKEVSEEYDKAKEEYDTKAKEVTDAADKLKEYENIDELVANSKKGYYAEIKNLEDKILAGESSAKIAYLTFDDGPYYSTWKVFDILEKNNVKATFFTQSGNGQYCWDKKSQNCWDLYKEYTKRGHTLANHTSEHSIWGTTYSSTGTFISQVKEQHDHILNQSGVTVNIFRFPGGIPTATKMLGQSGFETVTNELRNMGYGWVDWTAQDGDGLESLSSTTEAMNYLKNETQDKIEVILMHDYNEYTIAILTDAISYLRDKGYTLLPLFYESNMINK